MLPSTVSLKATGIRADRASDSQARESSFKGFERIPCLAILSVHKIGLLLHRSVAYAGNKTMFTGEVPRLGCQMEWIFSTLAENNHMFHVHVFLQTITFVATGIRDPLILWKRSPRTADVAACQIRGPIRILIQVFSQVAYLNLQARTTRRSNAASKESWQK